MDAERFPPSNGATFASILSLPTRDDFAVVADRAQAKGKQFGSVGNHNNKPNTDMGGRGLIVASTTLGDIEGVLWVVRGHLSGLSGEIFALMRKVNLGLSEFMGQGSGFVQIEEAVKKGEPVGPGLHRKGPDHPPSLAGPTSGKPLRPTNPVWWEKDPSQS